MDRPLVSIICLCYNHERFVKEAIKSVLEQSYENIELIVVDDCSQDASVQLIQTFVDEHPEIKFLSLKENLGNCKAFNAGLKLASGDFIIDFATDDVMMPNRIERQVDFFKHQDERVGVVFTNAVYINEKSEPFRNHYEYLFAKKLIDHIPEGDVFRNVLTTYFICSPTMMVKKEVMSALNGYDEELVYEDFDFWVRASRYFYFAYMNEKTTKVRKSSGSMSSGWYRQGDRQLHSTFLVCKKADALCHDQADRKALQWRVLYEFKQAIFSGNKSESKLFADLLKKIGGLPLSFYVIRLIAFLPLPWPLIRRKYHELVYH